MARSAKLIIVCIVLLGLGFCFYRPGAKKNHLTGVAKVQSRVSDSKFFRALNETAIQFKTTSFSPDIVSSTLSPNPKWAVQEPTAKEKRILESILSEKFTFLGEGAQAIAFQSKDGKYVLKLFKMRRFTPSLLDQLCPHVVRRRIRNLNWVFNGYKNAFVDLRKETGLVWIHLAKTKGINRKLTVVDKEGRTHLLDADETEFVIQEKADLLFHRLNRLAKEGKQEEVEKSIHAIYALVQQRIDKGYVDRDKAVSNNFGFVGDRAIQLDVGRLYKGRKERQLEHVQERIERWKSETKQPSS